MADLHETFVPHVGWLSHEAGDDVGRYLQEGWFEFAEQALWWLNLRPGDCVIDCGAHVGLFTLLASQAVGEYGKVIALEPNPATVAILRKNVDAVGARNVEVIQAAAAAKRGSLTLHAGSGSASAYSSSVAGVAATSTDVEVEAVSIDDLVRERVIERIALLKIDVEGAELEVWKGCAASARDGRIALAMVEFTEANQLKAGLTSADLISAWNETGYVFHRFDADGSLLVAADVQGPVEYENLFAMKEAEAIHRRLKEASPQRQRIARDVVARGRAAHALLKKACDVDHYRGLVVELQRQIADLQARLEASLRERGEFEHQLIDARHRAHTYAAYIDRVLNSKPGRIARALHLANTPDWIELMKSDLRQP
jgi:FkbM family methyltransferase